MQCGRKCYCDGQKTTGVVLISLLVVGGGDEWRHAAVASCLGLVLLSVQR
jgi:hypothetical protein